jgi:hypothetical protein
MGNLKKMILGEKMPDKDDPKYREKYEKDVEAGRRFARATKIDSLAGHIQKFAAKHGKLFLAIVFGFVIACFALNIYHLARAYKHKKKPDSATQMQEERLKERMLENDRTITLKEYEPTEED